MKRFLLITLLFLYLQPAFAQRMHFSDNTNVWSFIDSTTGCCIPYPVHYTTAQYVDSTIYNGHFYRYLSGSVASFLIREDSNRVYVIGTSDSIERILYDFNLTINDTLRLIYPQDTFTSWVTTLDSTQIAGSWYKVWHFNGIDASTFYPDSIRPYKYNVVEGIGCTNGPYYPASPYTLANFSQQLLCFKNDSVTNGLSVPVISYGYTYTQSFDNIVSCDTFNVHHTTTVGHTGVQTVTEEQQGAYVVPNPVAGVGKIVLPYYFSKGELIISNAIGQVVCRSSINNSSEITIGQNINTPGIYFYTIVDISDRAFRGVFQYW